MPQVPIHELVSRLRCCTDDNFTDVRHIHQLLRKLVVDPGSLETYLIWDRQHYTRNLIDKTPLYELVAICWEVGQASSDRKSTRLNSSHLGISYAVFCLKKKKKKKKKNYNKKKTKNKQTKY